MATSGSFTTTSYEGRSLTFSWNRTNYSITNNTSTIAWSVKGSGTLTGGYWVTCGDIDVVVNGTTVYNSSPEARINVKHGDVVASGTSTINHNADGTKSFSASVNAAIYNYTQNASGSKSFTLDTIPRSSGIDKVANSSGTSISTSNTQQEVRVYFTPKSTAFKYRVTLSMNGNTSQNNSAGVTVTTTAQTYYAVTIPHTWLPNKTSDTLTCKLETLNGTTVIGTSTKTISMTVPSVIVPSITGFTAAPNSTNSVINSWGMYVANYSYVKLMCSASGNSGSTIQKFIVSGSANITVNSGSFNYDLGLNSGGVKTYKIVAVDSRGRQSAEKSVTINVVNYYTPAIASFDVIRSDANGNASDSGTSAKLSFSGSYTNIGSNAATAKFSYKLSSSSTYTSLPTTSAGVNGKVNGGIIVSNITFATASEYDFQIQITDSMGNTVSRTVRLGTVTRTLNISKFGNGVAVGKMSSVANKTDAGKFEVGWDADFDKNMNVDGTLNVKGETTIDGRMYAKTHIYMGGNKQSSSEMHIRFSNPDASKYPHNTYIYGGSADNVNAVGMYDGKNNRQVCSYNDVNNSINLGGGGATVNFNGTALKDFIIEQGTSGIWTYRKWSKGDFECWGNVSVNPTVANGLNTTTVNLPITFANANFLVQITPAKCGLLVDRCGDCATNNAITHTVSSFVLSYNYSHATIYTTSFNVVVTGRWK